MVYGDFCDNIYHICIIQKKELSDNSVFLCILNLIIIPVCIYANKITLILYKQKPCIRQYLEINSY